MSGTVNANIPLSFQPTPNVGPNFGKAISDANNLVQLQQFKQQVERANKLRDILGAPDAIDPATGAPKPDTLSKVMSVDPPAGMKLQQNSLELQQHKLQMDRYKTDTFAKQFEMTKDVSNEAYTAYKQAVDEGKGEEAARAIGQRVKTEGLDRLATGGGFSDEQQKSWPRQFDPVQELGHVQTYEQWQKRKDAEKSEARKEKHDEQLNERSGAALGKDSKGRLVFAFPNAAPGKRLQYGDGSSVPPEEEGGFTKVGTGAGAQKDADNAAIEAGIRKDHSDWRENQVKLERMRQVAGATNKTLQDPTKGWEILTDAEGNDYQHRKGTGESLDMNGEPYAPKGHSTKLAGPRAPSAASQDWDAQVNVVRSAYETELGHPVDMTPGSSEKAELDKRVLAAEDNRVTGRAGATAGARQAATTKPMPITVGGKPQDGIWKNGQWFEPDGTTPITGQVRLAAKPAAGGSKAAEHATRFDEMKAAQQEAGIYKDDSSVYRALDHQEAEDKQTAISDDAALIAAQVALKTGHPPAWMGRSQASLTKFLDTYAAEAKRQGLTADDIAANTAKFSGEMAEARTLGTMSARVDFSAKELDVALPTAMEASQKVWRPGFKKLAEIQQAIKGQASDPDLLEFAQFNQQVMNAYSNMMNRGGVSTVHAMERAEALLSTATSQAGYIRQLDTLHKEVQTVLYGTQAAKDHLRAEITGSPEITTPPVLTGVPRTQGQQQWPIPNQKAIDAAKSDSKLRTQFEGAFGPGSLSKHGVQGAPAAAPQAAPAQPPPAPAATPAPAQPATPPARAPAPVQGTAATPLPLPKTEADLVDGGIYASDKGVVRFDKEKKRFFPVGGQ